MSDDPIREDIRNGDRARLLLADPILVGCFDRLRDEILAAWLGTGPGDTVEREAYFYQMNALNAVRAQLETIAAHGDVARADLEAMIARSKTEG